MLNCNSLSILYLLFFNYNFEFSQIKSFFGFSQFNQTPAEKKKLELQIDQLCVLIGKNAWTNPDLAMYYADSALSISETINYTKGKMNALKNRTHALMTKGDISQAFMDQFKVISLARKINDLETLSRANDAISGYYLQLGDYDKALEFNLEAINQASSLGSNLAVKYVNRGKLYLEKNNPDSAMYYAKKSYSIVNYWPTQPLVIGKSFLKLGKYDSAMHYFNIATELEVKNNLELDFVEIDIDKAILYKNTGNIDSAIYYSSKAINEKIANQYLKGTQKASKLLSDLYFIQHKMDSSFKYLQIAYELRDSLSQKGNLANILNMIISNSKEEQNRELLIIKRVNQRKVLLLFGGIMLLLLFLYFLRINNIKIRNQRNQIVIEKDKVNRALEALKATQNQLIQSEKMASLGELTAGIAHEIQNPLNFINNFSELNLDILREVEENLNGTLLNNSPPIINLRKNSEKIHRHGKRIDGIVKGMLQHSRAGNTVFEMADLNKICDENIRLAYQAFKAKDKSFGVQYETNLDPGLPLIKVNIQEMSRVTLNILNNAFYAVNEKSKKEKTRDLNGSEPFNPKVIIRTTKKENGISIGIADNGDGIIEANLKKIFQPFFTTKATGEGTGLGLSMSYDIVTKGHGGEIHVNSNIGVGTEFEIFIPFNN